MLSILIDFFKCELFLPTSLKMHFNFKHWHEVGDKELKRNVIYTKY